MIYTVQKLDGRFNYNERFAYAIQWHHSMSHNRGPLVFNQALQWCMSTWGWSAEVRQYYEIIQWAAMNHTLLTMPLRIARPKPATVKVNLELPPECNSHWSWSNVFNDLRIYLASDQELAWFQLANPVDQK